MDTTRSVWRSLRPVLLAAAVATSWMAFSAPAATASSGPDSPPGNATSSVTILATTATGLVGDILTAPPTDGAPGSAGVSPTAAVTSSLSAPALSPVVRDATRTADLLVQSVPVVSEIVPVDSLTRLTEPVVHIPDTAIGTTVDSLLGESGVVPGVLDPALKPAIDLVVAPAGSPVPETGLELPLKVDGGRLIELAVPTVGPTSGEIGALPAPVPFVFDAGNDPSRASVARLFDTFGFDSSAARGEWRPPATATAAPPAEPDGSLLDTLLDVLPAMPGSGSGGTSGPGAGPSTPAWLSAHGFDLPRTTGLPILGALLPSPSPVSFDPGSSPD